MNISKYEAFAKVAETGSITKAAKLLEYSQPGISHMIRALENELGFSLLKRSGGKFVPTENGARILHHCYQILKDENDLKKEAQAINGLMTGSITIGVFNSMIIDFIPDVVAYFSNIYPSIDISIQERDIDDMDSYLTGGQLDLAFMNDSVPNGFTFIPLLKDPVGVIMHKDHPFAQYDKIDSKMLNGVNFIMPSSGSYDIMDAIVKKEVFRPSVKCYVNSDSASVSLVSRNIGIAVISSLQKRLLTEDVIYKEFDGDFYRTLGICIKSLKYSTPAVKELINFSIKIAENSPNFCGRIY